MTKENITEILEYATIFRAARRCIRAYCALLHGLQPPELVDLSSFTDMEVAVLREMVMEMFGFYPFMDAGNCVLFIDDEVERRKELEGGGDTHDGEEGLRSR